MWRLGLAVLNAAYVLYGATHGFHSWVIAVNLFAALLCAWNAGRVYAYESLER